MEQQIYSIQMGVYHENEKNFTQNNEYTYTQKSSTRFDTQNNPDINTDQQQTNLQLFTRAQAQCSLQNEGQLEVVVKQCGEMPQQIQQGSHSDDVTEQEDLIEITINTKKQNKQINKHTYQNLGTQYYKFLQIESKNYYSQGITNRQYNKILDKAKERGLFKTKTEIENLHKSQSYQTQNYKGYIDLITQGLMQDSPDYIERVGVHSKFSEFNKERFRYFKPYIEVKINEIENDKNGISDKKQKKLISLKETLKGIEKIQKNI